MSNESLQLRSIDQLSKRRGCLGLNFLGPEQVRYEGRLMRAPVHVLIGDGTLDSAMRVLSESTDIAMVVDPNAADFAPAFFELIRSGNYTDAAGALAASFHETHMGQVYQGMLSHYAQYGASLFAPDLHERLFVFPDIFQNVPHGIADQISCFHPNPGEPVEGIESPMTPDVLIPHMIAMLKKGGSARILTNEELYFGNVVLTLQKMGLEQLATYSVLPAGREDLWSAYDVLLQNTEVFETVIRV
jgi:hypothetical protein